MYTCRYVPCYCTSDGHVESSVSLNRKAFDFWVEFLDNVYKINTLFLKKTLHIATIFANKQISVLFV